MTDEINLFSKKFQNFSGVQTPVVLEPSGKIPDWLSGSYFKMAMGMQKVGATTMRHWFDGYALACKFEFKHNQVLHQARLIDSEHYLISKRKNKIIYPEFGTSSNVSLLSRLCHIKNFFTDNTNINIIPFSEDLLTMTESTKAIFLDSNNLQTKRHIKYRDHHRMNLTLAHPHYDFSAKKMVNIGVSFGMKNFYHVYHMGKDCRRDILCSIAVKYPAYQHSFSITENYIILIEQALRLNPSLLLFNMLIRNKPYIESYHWQPERNNRFIIIEKATGTVKQILETEPFFFFHTINAFEYGKKIILDVHTYKDTSIINQLHLNKLHSSLYLPRIITSRFLLPLKGNSVSKKIINEGYYEFPRINYSSNNGKPYRYFYAIDASDAHQFGNKLVKQDLKHNQTQSWQEEHCNFGEPLFVQNTNSCIEDEGVVLSLVLNVAKSYSFLLILNAQSFIEIARVRLPHVIPMGLHGNFIVG